MSDETTSPADATEAATEAPAENTTATDASTETAPADALADIPSAVPPTPPAFPATCRDAMGIKGDVRVGPVQVNLSLAQCSFAIEEGRKTDEGFLPTRLAGSCTVTGDDYGEFLDEVAPVLMNFLKRKMNTALNNPPPPPQQ